MKAIFYTGTRAGWHGMGNILTRLRLRSRISHCELMFEPGDGVDALMPSDCKTLMSTTESLDGAYWCASSSATDRLPAWSRRRAGRSGGVRFKRINPADGKWIVVDLPRALAEPAVRWFLDNEGSMYDWRGILGFLAWPVPGMSSRWACHEACAAALGFAEPERTDPAALHSVLKWLGFVPHMAQPADGRPNAYR